MIYIFIQDDLLMKHAKGESVSEVCLDERRGKSPRLSPWLSWPEFPPIVYLADIRADMLTLISPCPDTA